MFNAFGELSRAVQCSKTLFHSLFQAGFSRRFQRIHVTHVLGSYRRPLWMPLVGVYRLLLNLNARHRCRQHFQNRFLNDVT